LIAEKRECVLILHVNFYAGKEEKHMFELNDKIIYPGHGVAVVKEVTEKKVGETHVRFFKLRFLYKDMTILVPISNVKVIGIRYPSNEETANHAIDELNKKPVKSLKSIDFTPSGWNRRNKAYQLKIQSGQLVEVAKIYRDLMHVSIHKDLSFGERSLLQITEELLVQELQIIQNKDKEHVVQEIRNPFKQLLFPDKDIVQDRTASVSSSPAS